MGLFVEGPKKSGKAHTYYDSRKDFKSRHSFGSEVVSGDGKERVYLLATNYVLSLALEGIRSLTCPLERHFQQPCFVYLSWWSPFGEEISPGGRHTSRAGVAS